MQKGRCIACALPDRYADQKGITVTLMARTRAEFLKRVCAKQPPTNSPAKLPCADQSNAMGSCPSPLSVRSVTIKSCPAPHQGRRTPGTVVWSDSTEPGEAHPAAAVVIHQPAPANARALPSPTAQFRPHAFPLRPPDTSTMPSSA